MDLRRLVRGTVPWADLERVARDVMERYDRSEVRVEFVSVDNWLSTPCVVNEEWFVKIISPQNALVHALFTGARNLGAVTSGSTGFFEQFDSPHEMAVHELEATRALREIGVNTPEPIEAFEVGDLGVLVLEYLPDFDTLDDADSTEVAQLSPELFATLRKMHDHQLAHGDLRRENVLIYGDELYFIDVTKVREDGIDSSAPYDLASALASLSPDIGEDRAVDDALRYYDIDHLLAAREFIDIVSLRPDHEFDATRLKGTIETRASRQAQRRWVTGE